jgi:hypothetical protein
VGVDLELRILNGVRPDPPEVIAREILMCNRLPSGPSNVVIRRDVLLAVGPFDTVLRYHEDWDLWIRLAQTGPPAAVERPLLAHTLHQGNAPVDRIVHDLRVIEERYAALRGGRRVDWAAAYRWIASSHLVAGRRGAAARAYAQAVIRDPVRSARLAGKAVMSPDIGAGSAYRQPPDAEWRAQAEVWLAPLRAKLREDPCAR